MLKDEPVPIAPSMFDVHDSDALISPSSASVAEPEKLTESSSMCEESFEGEVMVTVGVSFMGLTVIDTVAALLVAPSLSSMVYSKLSEMVSEPS